MKVLHIGWGFRPWRGGGLIEYTEDLMNIQANNGWDVYYFFSCRHYPFAETSLKKWKNGNITVFEVINSPIFHSGDLGTSYPQLELSEEYTENFFREVLNKIKPDIIHIQELAGLPSSLIDIIKDEYNIPLVMTLHDFFLLCPTLNLFNSNYENCFKNQIGEECVKCCVNAYNSILKYQIHSWINNKLLKKLHFDLFSNFKVKKNRNKSNTYNNLINKSSLYQKRRDVNIKRLEKIDLLIAQSYRVEEIYRKFLKSDNLITLHSTVKHLDLINPKKLKVKHPIKFATLSGCYSIKKGSKLIFETIQILNKRGISNLFELHIWGELDYNIKSIVNFSNVYSHGSYNINQLDQILGNIDVGIIPSTLEEAYGYTGIEFLAKGIPIIGNKKGGIVDYTHNNSTGWVNETASAEELADLIEHIIKNPDEIVELNRKILNNKELIKSMDAHFKEIKNIYHQVISA